MLAFPDRLLDTEPMSQVVYARVPDALKDALDAYATTAGTTLTAAVVDLLGRGLASTSDERSIDELRARLAAEVDQRRQLEAAVHASRVELGALEMLRQRSAHTVATCPNPQCGAEVSGFDVLATGRCTSCGHSLGQLAASAAALRSVDQRELLLLLGAIGTVLGVAWLASKNA